MPSKRKSSRLLRPMTITVSSRERPIDEFIPPEDDSFLAYARRFNITSSNGILHFEGSKKPLSPSLIEMMKDNKEMEELQNREIELMNFGYESGIDDDALSDYSFGTGTLDRRTKNVSPQFSFEEDMDVSDKCDTGIANDRESLKSIKAQQKNTSFEHSATAHIDPVHVINDSTTNSRAENSPKHKSVELPLPKPLLDSSFETETAACEIKNVSSQFSFDEDMDVSDKCETGIANDRESLKLVEAHENNVSVEPSFKTDTNITEDATTDENVFAKLFNLNG